MASQEVLLALDSLHRELEKLEPAIKHVETAQQVTEIVKGIPQKHLDFLEEITKADSNFKNGLQKIFEREIKVLITENKKLAETTSEIQEQVKLEQVALSKLKDTVQSFHDRVESINFPERLDKSDARIVGIMEAILLVQSRLDCLDSLERNISNRLKDILYYQEETRSVLQSTIEQSKSSILSSINESSKNQKLLMYITWGLIIGLVVFLFLVKLKIR